MFRSPFFVKKYSAPYLEELIQIKFDKKLLEYQIELDKKYVTGVSSDVWAKKMQGFNIINNMCKEVKDDTNLLKSKIEVLKEEEYYHIDEQNKKKNKSIGAPEFIERGSINKVRCRQRISEKWDQYLKDYHEINKLKDEVIESIRQQNERIEIPAYFICPLTNEVMVSPTYCSVDMKTYEKKAIEAWFKNNDCTPDGLKLSPVQKRHKILSPHKPLAEEMERYLMASNPPRLRSPR